MEKTIQEITKEFLKEKSLQGFANGLGINASRQMVFSWKEGTQEPSTLTLFSVLASPLAESWAKAWAGECLSALQARIFSKN